VSSAARAALFAVGVYHLGFGLFHLGFWKLFRWKEELARLGHVNRAIMQVLNLCLAYLAFAFAVLAFAFPHSLGDAVLGVLAGLWLLRAALQVVYFRRVGARINAALVALFLLGAALPIVAIAAR
jgi:hypothetical protein